MENKSKVQKLHAVLRHNSVEVQSFLIVLVQHKLVHKVSEEKEAERKRIEAAGIRDAQLIIKEGITQENIEWKSLEVLKEISMSPNAKLILTDGKTPVLIGGDKD